MVRETCREFGVKMHLSSGESDSDPTLKARSAFFGVGTGLKTEQVTTCHLSR